MHQPKPVIVKSREHVEEEASSLMQDGRYNAYNRVEKKEHFNTNADFRDRTKLMHDIGEHRKFLLNLDEWKSPIEYSHILQHHKDFVEHLGLATIGQTINPVKLMNNSALFFVSCDNIKDIKLNRYGLSSERNWVT
jgi:hypothetical protein